jgi:8-oxo-dGTP diphosphatase
MRRKFPRQPIVGVGAVIIHHDSVLLIQRGTPPMLGEWTLPGGMVELGETLQDAVKREIREETNLEIQVGPLLELFERIEQDGDRTAYHYVIADFLACKMKGRLKASSDVRAARFVPRSELRNFHLTPIAQRVILRGFKLTRRKSSSPKNARD